MEFGGIAGEIAKFNGLAAGVDEACRRAVKAGGEYLAKKLGENAPVDTGALSRSVKAGTVQYSAGDGWHCRVAPVGENHGESLAKIGNIIEYGHGKVPARAWFMPTVAREESAVIEAMGRAFDEAQKKGAGG